MLKKKDGFTKKEGMKYMNIEKFLKKSYIWGGRCPECNGFLFTEVLHKTPENPFCIQQRCLKCGHTIDVTEKVNIDAEDTKAEKEWTPNKDPNIYIKEEPYLEKYKRMLTEV